MIDDLRHIRAFLAAARTKNFTRAARQSHISQSAFTVQIRQLEDALGVSLFDRSKRRVSLTAAGGELLAPLERLVIDAEAIVGQTRQLTELRRGIVSMAVLPSVAAEVLPGIIQSFVQLYPGIVVQIKDVVAEKIMEMVRREEVEFGIGIRMAQDRDTVATPLLVDRLCAFVPTSHVLAKRDSVTLKELASVPLILTGKDSSVREIVERALKQERLILTLAYEANYMATAIGMARAGLGIAVLPEFACGFGNGADVRRVAISKPVLSRHIEIIERKDRTQSPAVRKMVETIRNGLSGRSATHGL